jgi:hypothetical protein
MVRMPTSRRGVRAAWVGATVVAAIALLAAILAAAHVVPVPSDPVETGPPFGDGNFGDVLLFIARNVLVAGLVAVLGGVLIGARRERELVARRRVVAAAATILFATQVYQQGHALAWIGSYLGVPVSTLLLAMLPHAVIELTALLLPITAAVFIVRDPRRLERGMPTPGAALVVALPLIVVAAVIETYLSPRVYRATACTTGGEPAQVAQGGCKACPDWVDAAFSDSIRRHEPVSEAAARWLGRGCRSGDGHVPSGYEQPAPGSGASGAFR